MIRRPIIHTVYGYLFSGCVYVRSALVGPFIWYLEDKNKQIHCLRLCKNCAPLQSDAYVCWSRSATPYKE